MNVYADATRRFRKALPEPMTIRGKINPLPPKAVEQLRAACKRRGEQ